MPYEEFDSELSEVTDSEEDDNPSHPTAKAAPGFSKAKESYEIQNALKVPRATTYTAQALYDQIYSNDVDLEPEYQRDVVWPETKQVGIIDSIYRNFYIPPIIFAVKQHSDGTETRTCIDGKQRLTSIYRFMGGTIAHKDPYSGEKLWYKDDGTSSSSRPKKLLPEKYRKLFANKQIVCVEYQDLTDADEREIFQRVQLGMALTPAEKLQVIKSPRADFIRKIQSVYIDNDGPLSSECLNWERSRGGGFRCLANAADLLWFGNDKLKASLSIGRVEKFLKDPSPRSLTKEMRDTLDSTFHVFSRLVMDSASLKGKANVFMHPTKTAPVEFVAFAYLIGKLRDRLNLDQLRTCIGELRASIRKTHSDVRMNDRVWKDVAAFVASVKTKATGLSAAAIVAKQGPSPLAKEENRDKRKRDEESSEEEEQPPVKQKKQHVATPTVNSEQFSASTPSLTIPPSEHTPAPPRHSMVRDRVNAHRAAKSAAPSLFSLPPLETSFSSNQGSPNALSFNQVVPNNINQLTNMASSNPSQPLALPSDLVLPNAVRSSIVPQNTVMASYAVPSPVIAPQNPGNGMPIPIPGSGSNAPVTYQENLLMGWSQQPPFPPPNPPPLVDRGRERSNYDRERDRDRDYRSRNSQELGRRTSNYSRRSKSRERNPAPSRSAGYYDGRRAR